MSLEARNRRARRDQIAKLEQQVCDLAIRLDQMEKDVLATLADEPLDQPGLWIPAILLSGRGYA